MYLITPSLYSSWYWYKLEKKSYEDFFKTLNKISIETTSAMQAGIDFENNIRLSSECLDEVEVDEDPIMKQIAEIVRGGVWQKTCKKELGNYLLYGKMDVWTPTKIYDIKYTRNPKLIKYKYSIQHLLYMYCTGVEFFDYLISDGKDLLVESYEYNERLESLLKERIDEMVDFINFVPEFKEAFETHWTVKENKNEEIKKDKKVLIVLEEIRRGLVH